MFEYSCSKLSKFEFAFEEGVQHFCNQKGIGLRAFSKYGHSEFGPLNNELNYDILLYADEDLVDEFCKRFGCEFIEGTENGIVVVKSMVFPALMDENENYSMYSIEELDYERAVFDKFIENCDAFVKSIEDDYGFTALGVSNRDRFSKCIESGFSDKIIE